MTNSLQRIQQVVNDVSLFQKMVEETLMRLVFYHKSKKVEEFESWKEFYENVFQTVWQQCDLSKEFMDIAREIYKIDLESNLSGLLSYYGETYPDNSSLTEIIKLKERLDDFREQLSDSTSSLHKSWYLRTKIKMLATFRRYKVAKLDETTPEIMNEDGGSLQEIQELLRLIDNHFNAGQSHQWSLLAVDLSCSGDFVSVGQQLHLVGREDQFENISTYLQSLSFYQMYGTTSLGVIKLQGIILSTWNNSNICLLSPSPMESDKELVVTLVHYFLACSHQLSKPISSSSCQMNVEQASLISSCSRLVSEIRKEKSSLFVAIPPWMYLHLARVLFFRYGEVVEALRYCCKGLAQCPTASRSLLSLPFMMVRFELSLLIAEIYDFAGNPTRCLEYLSESRHWAGASSYLQDIFQLHSLRIFVRMKSDKVPSIISSIPSSTSYLASQWKEIIATLADFVPSIKKEMMLASINSNNEKVFLEDSLQYRYLYRLWGIEVKGQNQTTSSLQQQSDFVITMASTEERQIVKRLSSTTTSSTGASAASPLSKEDDHHLWECLSNDRIYAKFCYQTIKQLRKVQSSHLVQSHVDHDYLALLSTLASIRMNDELSELRLSDLDSTASSLASSESKSSSGDSLLNHYGEVIRQAVHTRNSEVINSLMERIQSLLQSSSSHNPKEVKKAALISLSLDHSSQRLVVSSCHSIVNSGSSSDSSLHPHLQYLTGQEFEKFISIITAWNEVISESNSSLVQFTTTTASSLTVEQRKQWWTKRTDIDTRMKQILKDMNQVMLPILKEFLTTREGKRSKSVSAIDPVKKIRSNRIQRHREEDAENAVPVANQLTEEMDLIDKIFEEKLHIGSESTKEESKSSQTAYEQMKLVDLKQELKNRNLNSTGKKAELIQRLIDNDADRNNQRSPLGSKSATGGLNKRPQARMKLSTAPSSLSLSKSASSLAFIEEPSRQPSTVTFQDWTLFLLIEDSLQQFPFESLECFEGSYCSRLLSLVHLLRVSDILANPSPPSSTSTANTTGLKEINPRKSLFLVDLENNLPDTAERMSAFIDSHPLSRYWTTFCGSAPSENLLRESILSNEVLVYCGHGSGESYQKVIRKEREKVPACFLFGCSSARLKDRGAHEPVGTLKLLLDKASPFVMGNLWDVTDKDLDRFTVHTLSAYYSNSQSSTECHTPFITSQSRSVCKLVTAVGAAPVIYGIPLRCSMNLE